jgi:citrate lyase alpha subunit
MVNYHLLEPDDKRIRKGKSNQISQNAKITLDRMEVRKSVGPEVSEFILQVGAGAASVAIGNYIYDRLKDSDITSLQIGGEEVKVEEESIQEKLDKYTDD